MKDSQSPAVYSSTSLLSGLLYDPLNYGYSYSEGSVKPASAYQKVLVFFLAAAIAFGTTVAVRALLSSRTERLDTYQGLLQQVRAEHDLNQQLLAEVADLELQLKSETTGEVSVSGLSDELLLAAHLVSVTGRGVAITLESKSQEGGDSNIQDQDLRLLLNELWRSEAEAIAINGIRVGPRTPVRTAGSSVLVNYHPVQQPYVLEVVGPADKLEQGVTSGVTGDYFRDLYKDYGISLVLEQKNSLVLPPMKVPQINLQSIKEMGKGK